MTATRVPIEHPQQTDCDRALLHTLGEPAERVWAEPFHEAWQANEGLPRPLRLARALRHQWRHSRPIIKEAELVLGRWGIAPVVFGHGDGSVSFDAEAHERYLHQFRAHEEKVQLLEEIAAEWRDHNWYSRVAQALEQLGPGMRIVSPSNLYPWRGHSAQDYSLLLKLGAHGMRERIKQAWAENPSAEEGWYESLLEIVTGICDFGQALRESAVAAAQTAKTPQREAELLGIAGLLERCPEEPPQTFRQAVQTYWIVFFLNGHDSNGRIDQDLGPYLERDLREGVITEREAQDVIASLWVRFEEHRCWSTVVGGTDRRGRDACNLFTRMAIEATERLGTAAPSLSLRVHPRLPDDVMRLACRAIAKGGGMPALVNDGPIIRSLRARGMSVEDARDYALTGCTQVVIPGRTYSGFEDAELNALKWLELALHNGEAYDDGKHEKLVGLRTGPPEDLRTFDQLMVAWQTQMREIIGRAVTNANTNLRVLGEEFPSPLRSILGYDAVERGTDVRRGGYRYCVGLVNVIGLTNLADGLAVIRQLVYEQEELSLREFVDILDVDWKGHEALRQRCLREIPKFGTGHAEHDALVADVVERCRRELARHHTQYGNGQYNLDIVGYTEFVAHGAETGASADGRKAGDALADSCGASAGRDAYGPTALLRSAARLCHDRAHGVLALNLRFPGSIFRSDEDLDRLADLVKTYFVMGGQQAQINVVDSQTLRDAQQHPERYESLIVRVGGYTTKWNWLDKDLQQAIIARTEHGG